MDVVAIWYHVYGFMSQLCQISFRREHKGPEFGHGSDLQKTPVVSPHHFLMDIDWHSLSLFAFIIYAGVPEILLCAWISLLLSR